MTAHRMIIVKYVYQYFQYERHDCTSTLVLRVVICLRVANRGIKWAAYELAQAL